MFKNYFAQITYFFNFSIIPGKLTILIPVKIKTAEKASLNDTSSPKIIIASIPPIIG